MIAKSGLRLLTIQRLRALAAILVIGVHAGRLELRAFPSTWLHPLQAFGGAGVDLFFVISGFIMITTTWSDFGVRGSSPAFLVRRILRIYPIYWVVMAVYLVLNALAPNILHIDDGSPQSIVASLLLLPQGHEPILVVAWTLVCEMFFYLFFALALLVSRPMATRCFLVWIALTIVFNVVHILPDNPFFAQITSPFNLEFALGIGVGWLINTNRVRAPQAMAGVGLAGLAAAFVYLVPMDDFPSVWFRVFCIAIPMAFLVYGATGIEIRAGGHKPDALTRIGDASYSLYLWHPFLLATFTTIALRLHPHGPVAHALYLIGLYAFTIGVSVVLYRLIERPMTKALHRRVEARERARAAALAS